MDERVITSLQELGLGMYESRLYVGLLTHGPQNANELSRAVGVPSSKTYSTLDRLGAAGMVQIRRKGRLVEYEPTPAEEVFRLLKARITRPLEYLEDALPQLAGSATPEEFLRMVGETAILDRSRQLIAETEDELYLSAWETHLDGLWEPLADAHRRQVNVISMIYGDSELGVGLSLQHSYRDTVASRIHGRMLTLIGDGKQALVAHFPDEGEASGVASVNPVVCLIAEEYLRHDVLLQEAKHRTGFDRWSQWIQADSDIRRITLGRSGRESSIEPRSDPPKNRRSRSAGRDLPAGEPPASA